MSLEGKKMNAYRQSRSSNLLEPTTNSEKRINILQLHILHCSIIQQAQQFHSLKQAFKEFYLANRLTHSFWVLPSSRPHSSHSLNQLNNQIQSAHAKTYHNFKILQKERIHLNTNYNQIYAETPIKTQPDHKIKPIIPSNW